MPQDNTEKPPTHPVQVHSLRGLQSADRPRAQWTRSELQNGARWLETLHHQMNIPQTAAMRDAAAMFRMLLEHHDKTQPKDDPDLLRALRRSRP